MAKKDVKPETPATTGTESEEIQLQVRKLDVLETTEPRPMFI
jgi:hypothetical protein